jgi:hypothetical protein
MEVGGPGVRFDRDVTTGQNLSGGTFVLGAWNHVAATYNGDTAVLYLNGADVRNRQQSGDMSVPTEAFTIGNGAGWAPITGTIDEVAIYDYPLLPGDVLAHYQAGLVAMQ